MLTELLTKLEETPVATAMKESIWLFPTVETLHVVAITLVVGSISMIDLRLLQLSSRNYSVTRMTEEVLPWTWASFAAAAVTGGMLFASNAVKYSENWPFRIKMVLLVLAGLNMILFHVITYRTVHNWNESPQTPFSAKLAGGLSLGFWVFVVAAGRWIGFTI
jgi:hypothetical protein